jgi:hypothetical protein
MKTSHKEYTAIMSVGRPLCQQSRKRPAMLPHVDMLTIPLYVVPQAAVLALVPAWAHVANYTTTFTHYTYSTYIAFVV